MHANGVEKPDPPVFSYKFQGIFNVFNESVFSELATMAHKGHAANKNETLQTKKESCN